MVSVGDTPSGMDVAVAVAETVLTDGEPVAEAPGTGDPVAVLLRCSVAVTGQMVV